MLKQKDYGKRKKGRRTLPYVQGLLLMVLLCVLIDVCLLVELLSGES